MRPTIALLAGIALGSSMLVGIACTEDPATQSEKGNPVDGSVHADADASAVGDGPSSDDDSPPTILWEYRRDLTATVLAFDVTATALRADGTPFSGEIELETEGGVLSGVAKTAGRTTARVVSQTANGTVLLRGRTTDGIHPVVSERRVVALPTVSSRWDVVELVPGLVNSPGTEDSAEISPDGEWLVVSTYSPFDLLCCLVGIPGCAASGGTASSKACNAPLGPIDAPSRPDLFGRDRILSSTDTFHATKRLGLAEEDGGELPFAMPPVSAYGFHRQVDGTFAAPFVIGVEMDGHPQAPFGFAFVGTPVGTSARVLYAWNKPYDDPDTENDLYVANVELGKKVLLGTFQFDDTASLHDFASTRVALPAPLENQGNPGASPAFLYWDSEHTASERLWSASWDGGSAVGTPAAIPLSDGSHRDLQPFADGSRLYFARDVASIVSAERSGTSTWSALEEDVAMGAQGTATGSIVSLGEPSIAHAADGTWLYFVVYLRTATGYDGAVARVRAR